MPIIIVGGGIAGLSAGYELVKAGRSDVIIFEASEYMGGSVKSATISKSDISVDFGSSDLFADYVNVLRLCEDLGIIDTYVNDAVEARVITPDEAGCYTVVDCWQQIFSHQQFIPFMLKSIELGVFTDDRYLSFYYPNLKRFGVKTFGEYLDDFADLKKFVDRRLVSLGYGCADEIPMSQAIPLLTKNFSPLSFGGRTFVLVDALVEYIRANGGSIRSGCRVVSVESKAKIKRTACILNTKNGEYERILFSDMIVACALDTIPTGAISSCAQILVNSNPVCGTTSVPQYRYTHTLSVLIEVDQLPTYGAQRSSDWTSCYEPLSSAAGLQLVRIENLDAYSGTDRNWLHLYFQTSNVNDLKMFRNRQPSLQRTAHAAVIAIVQSAMRDTLLLCSSALMDVLHFEAIPRTYPVLNSAGIAALHARNGENSIWFAGGHMGTMSCLETACFSGRRMAFAVLGSQDLAAFDDETRMYESRCISAFRFNTVGKYMFSALASGVTLGFTLELLKWKKSCVLMPVTTEPHHVPNDDYLLENASSTSLILEELRH